MNVKHIVAYVIDLFIYLILICVFYTSTEVATDYQDSCAGEGTIHFLTYMVSVLLLNKQKSLAFDL